MIVRADTPGGRTFHALIPLSVVSADMAPTLALSRNPALSDDLPMDRLRLRPIAGLRQPFHVFVKNPSDRSWSVIVEVLEGDKVVGSSGAKPLTIDAHSSIKVPDFGGPAPKPGAELPEPAAPLRLRLSDASRTVLDEQPLRAAIAAPADYLEATRVEFVPDAPGQPNRLTVDLRALPALAGPPCPVELVLPIDKELFPSLRELPRSGKLVGELAPGKSELTLYAEGITLDPGEDTEGSFYLNVNGVRRALWFRSRFPQIGGPQRAAESRRPRVRFVASPRVEPNKLGAARRRLPGQRRPGRLRAGRPPGPGPRRADRRRPDVERPAKRRHLGFDPRGEGGALLFEASIEDQVWNPAIPGLVGPHRLQARLLDATRRNELAAFETELILDDQPPSGMLVEVPAQIMRGKSLAVRASVVPPPSKIKDVSFIFGPKADFEKAVTEDRTVKARGNPQGRDWSATLPVAKDAPAKLVVTARFTSGVGLTAFQVRRSRRDRPAQCRGDEAGRTQKGDHQRDREGRGPAPARPEGLPLRSHGPGRQEPPRGLDGHR